MKRTDKGDSGFLFVSGAVYRRLPIFRYERPRSIFLESLEAYRQKYRYKVLAFVLMPDHFHLLIWFPPDHRFTNFLRDFKSWTARQILAWAEQSRLERIRAALLLSRDRQKSKDARYCVLQHDSYVTALEGGRAVLEKVDYIHMNPVRAGIVEAPEEYPFSSASRSECARVVQCSPFR